MIFLENATNIVYLDIASIVLNVLLLVSMFIKEIYKRKGSRIFMLMILLSIINIVFDILSSYPETLQYNGLMAVNSIYFILRLLTSFFYLIYIIQLTDVWVTFKNKFYIFLLFIPFIIGLIFILLNPMYDNFIFNINKDTLKYSLGNFIFIIYIVFMFYLGIAAIYVIKYKMFFTRYQEITLISIIPLSLIAAIIQYFIPTLLIELFSTSIAFYLISASVETKELIVDERTNLRNLSNFHGVVKRSYALKRETHVLILKIENYSELYNLLNYDDAVAYLKRMSLLFSNRYKGIDQKYETFYLDQGLFAATSYDYNKLRKISILMSEELENKNISMAEYKPKKSICLLTMPDVFKNESELFKFISNYHTRLDFDKNVTFLNDIVKNENFIIQNDIDKIIDEALKKQNFEVFYQPIYNVKENSFTSAEALVRIKAKNYGYISPLKFIPYAEKTGRISDIDKFVLESVLKFISEDIFNDLNIDFIEINLSVAEFGNELLTEEINKILAKYSVEREKINIEITESVASTKMEIDDHIMNLCNKGIRISLDDYGTGYSNIERFSKIPFSIIKIDKTLVDNSETESMKQVLKNTFSMIKDLKRKSVVEGIETKEQADRFIDFGCDYIQGFYYSKPLPKQDFINFILKNKNK